MLLLPSGGSAQTSTPCPALSCYTLLLNSDHPSDDILMYPNSPAPPAAAVKVDCDANPACQGFVIRTSSGSFVDGAYTKAVIFPVETSSNWCLYYKSATGNFMCLMPLVWCWLQPQ